MVKVKNRKPAVLKTLECRFLNVGGMGNSELRIFNNKGAILLPMILMISAVVFMIGMAGLAAGVAFNRSNASIRASNMALEAARSGIADAQRIILRDPQRTSLSSCVSLSSTPSYSFSVSDEAAVDVCVKKTGNQYRVQALGKARLREKLLETVIDIDPITNQIRTQSINEVEF